jgi:hypothetical protein
MSIIMLTSEQWKTRDFDHPMLNESITFGEAEEVFRKFKEGDIDEEDYFFDMCKYAKREIGKLLYNWPETERFQDDLVSVAFKSLWESRDKTTIKSVVNKLQRDLSYYLNDNKCLVTPKTRQQWYLKSQGKDLMQPTCNTIGFLFDEDQPSEPADIWKGEAYEYLMNHTETEVDEAILDSANWGMKTKDLAEKLGVSRSNIQRRKKRLLDIYLRGE